MRYFFLLLLAACAALTEEEIILRDEKRSVDFENWYMCKKIYASSHVPTVHIGHSHANINKNMNDLPRAIRSDLHQNSCRFIMRDYWVEYPDYD